MPRSLPVLPVLPDMRCDANCTLCCSEPVPVTEAELVRVLSWANERDLLPQVAEPHMCPWYQGGRCAVHQVRPAICQLYGHHPSMTCPKGYNADVSDETAGEFFLAAGGGAATRFLHEVVDAALPDPRESVWRARVQSHAWDGVNRFRATAGLAPLERAYHSDSEGRIVSNG